MNRSLKYGLVGLGVSGVAYYHMLDSSRQRHLMESMNASYRIMNLIYTVTNIALDYKYHLSFQSHRNDQQKDKLISELKNLQNDQEKLTFTLWNLNKTNEKKSIQDKIYSNRLRIEEISAKLASLSIRDDGKSVLSDIHHRSAIKLRNMCCQNKGVYIKLGQHISMLDHIIPIEYQLELSKLLANNPHSSWESIERVFLQEFSQHPDQLFHDFERVPIASASLAQVHVAYDDNGNKLAVKVQHEGLQQGSIADRIAITFVIELLSRIFKDFNYNWLTKEMST